jgi:hypothetical protein
MQKFLILLTATLCSTAILHAQSTYNRAIGVKAFTSLSATYKQFLTPKNNVEAEFTAWRQGYRVSGLYEFNFYSFKTVEGLSWFVGPGIHAGVSKDDAEKDGNSLFNFGFDGIIGFDYKFRDIPINVSVDWQPTVNIVGVTEFPSLGGVAVRYTF